MIKTLLSIWFAIGSLGYCAGSNADKISANLFLNKGYDLLKNAEYDSSVYYFKKSAAIYMQEKVWQKYVECLNNLATNYLRLGNYQTAISHAEKALEICHEKLSATNPEVSYAYNGLGNIYRNMGNYSLAIKYYQQSKDIKIKNLGENHIDVTKAYNNMAIAYNLQGNFNLGINLFIKALRIREKVLPVNHRLITNSYNNIGATYWEMGLYDSALLYHEKTLRIREITLGKHPLTGNSLNNIGAVHEMQNQYPLALLYYKKAIGLFRDIFGQSHPLINSTAINIGDVYLKSNQYDSALQYYQEAIIAVAGNFNDTNPTINPLIKEASNLFDLIPALSLKASVFELKYDKLHDESLLYTALATIQKCDTAIIMVRNRQQEIMDKLTLGANIKSAYSTGISICKKLYEITNDDQFAELIFYFMERSKSAILQQATSDLTAKNFGNIPDHMLKLEDELKNEEARLRSLLLNPAGADSISHLKNKLFLLKRRQDSLTTSFENTYPSYYALKYQTHIPTIKELQNNFLSQKDALIEYFIDESNLYIIAITKEEYRVIGTQADTTFSKNLNTFTSNVSANQNFEKFSLYTNAAYQLYKKLLEPVLDIIDKKNLIIVPDGQLALIPMDALLTEPATSVGVNYRALAFLLKSHNTCYGNSSTTLMNRYRKQAAPSKPVSIAAFAPSFENSNSSNLLSAEQGILRFSKEEVQMLNSYFKTTGFLGTVADETAFKEYANQHNILHIASHAYADSENPMNSKIAFSTNTRDSLDDGFLHAFELFNTRLDADMIVLSACNTGFGNVQKGEGVMSLGYAFSYAGVSSVLMSHWQIDDKSTYLLMQNFYRNLADGMSKTNALRKAKLSMLGGKEITYSNPYYWAAFIIYGDPKPLVSDNYPWVYLVLIMVGIAIVFIFLIKKFR